MKIQFVITLLSILITPMSCDKKPETSETTPENAGDDPEDKKTPEEDDEDKEKGGTTGTIAISTLDEVPAVLGPVLPVKSDDDSKNAEDTREFDTLAIETELKLVAKTGASMGETVADLNEKFEAASNPSKAMCDVTNQMMKFVFEAGSPDFMACIIKGAGLSDKKSTYDGTNKKLKLLATTDEGTKSFLVQLNLKKKNDTITQFTFHSCEETEGEFHQNQWFEMKVGKQDLSIASKMTGPSGSISVLNLSGPVDKKGKFVGLKKIKYKDTITTGENDRYVSSEVTQSAANMLLNSYTSDNDGTNYYSFFQILDKNTSGTPYAITKLAVGDGAALIRRDNNAVVQGWNGDTFNLNADEKRIDKVEEAATMLLPTLSEANETYTGTEAFDCDPEGATEIELDTEVVNGCMERFQIDQEGENFCSGLTYE